MPEREPDYDVIVVGGGPAGLSAALILGRCRRRVLLCDAGAPRNAMSDALHGFLTRDGIAPAELLRIGRKQLRRYPSVEVRDIVVADASREAKGFDVMLEDGTRYATRLLMLATGVVDELPNVEGFESLYGHSAFHCPYCDGWEWRDRPLAVYGQGKAVMALALELKGWSDDLVVCTDGPSDLGPHDLGRLASNGIAVREEGVKRLEGTEGQLEHVVFEDGEVLSRHALFFTTSQRQHSDLARKLGCEITEEGTVRTGAYELTHVEGLYVVGDASRAVQLAIVAAAEGAEAAFAANQVLLKEELK